eukprot:TRINITY_DN5552_c0_g1_i1.p1 TRINITY_DN5552_c0_g1~~TRINITY_DN5552_c0_g1_i1.p1  ORF type:complete len:648 (+),score=131.19 TRINITY_DN5552_c0_g1_i1:78-2021(+)
MVRLRDPPPPPRHRFTSSTVLGLLAITVIPLIFSLRMESQQLLGLGSSSAWLLEMYKQPARSPPEQTNPTIETRDLAIHPSTSEQTAATELPSSQPSMSLHSMAPTVPPPPQVTASVSDSESNKAATNAVDSLTLSPQPTARSPGPDPAAAVVPSAPSSNNAMSPQPTARSPGPDPAAAVVPSEPISNNAILLFCFCWTPRRKYDEILLQEVRKQYAKCDGHAFFTDMDSPGEEDPSFVKVKLPTQSVARSDSGWLYHRNMVGLMPSWNHLVKSAWVDKYDWFINTELDHFFSPARARTNIAGYLKVLQHGTDSEKASLDGPMQLMWGNAFVFNRKLVQGMREHWQMLGKTAKADGDREEKIAVGCPRWMRGRSEWPQSCSQDIVYPTMAWDILPNSAKLKVANVGDPGCGHSAKNKKNQAFPLGCWEMQQNPLNGQSEGGELAAIKELAHMGTLPNWAAAKAYCASHLQAAVRNNCAKFYDGRNVAIIHHVGHLSVHKLARKLLDNDANNTDVSDVSLDASSPEVAKPPRPKGKAASGHVMGEAGEAECPKGSKPMPDADACSAAADSLGQKFAGEFPSDGDAQGCLYRIPDMDIYFNPQETGKGGSPERQMVCQEPTVQAALREERAAAASQLDALSAKEQKKRR